MSRIFGNDRPDFNRKRTVREAASISPSAAPAPVEKPAVDEVYDQYADIIDAANAVLPYFADAAMASSVNVPANMPELRAAVARKDKLQPDGAKISFDLFTKTLAHFEELRNEFTINGLEELTGNDARDAANIQGKASRKGTNLSDDDMSIWNSAWFGRFVLWQLLKQFAVNTILKQTAPKMPPGTEQPGYVAEFVSSVGLGFVIEAANAEFAKLAAEGNEYVQDFVDSTNERASVEGVEFSKLEQMAIDKIAEGDFAKIMDYCIKEVSSTSDAALLSWISYANVRGIRNDAVGTYRHSPQYTGSNPDLNGPLVPMSQAHLSVLEKNVKSINGVLTLNVQAAGLTFNADMLCCMTKLFGNITTEKLQAVRQMLKLAQKMRSTELSYLTSQVSSGFTNFLAKATSSSLITVLERTLDKVVIKALDTVDMEDEDYRLVSDICPAYLDYSEIMFDAAEYLMDLIRDMVTDAGNTPIAAAPSKNPYALSNGHIIHKKWIDTALRLIDEVINVIDNGNCDLDEYGRIPAERTKELVANAYVSASSGTVQIPDEVIEKHFPHMEEISVPAPGGRYSFTVPKNGASASSVDERTAMKDVFKRCGKTLSNEELDRILKDTNGPI